MTTKWMLCALLLVGFCTFAVAEPGSSPVSAAQVQAEETNDLEGASPADRSPLEDLNPAESTWQVWLGPIAIGVFALILAFLIRRFSMGSRNRPRDDDNQPSNR